MEPFQTVSKAVLTLTFLHGEDTDVEGHYQSALVLDPD